MSRFFSTRATSGVVGPPRDPVVAQWLGMSDRSASGMNVTPDNAMRVTAVYRAVSLKAQVYASLPQDIYRIADDGSLTPDHKHPLWQVLCKRPNRWQTPFEWRQMMDGHFAMRGRAYSEIISSGGAAVAELVPLHPDRVRPFRAPNGQLAFEYTPPSGVSRIILQDEMHWMHGLTTDEDGVTPLSPIQVAGREAIGLAMATQEHSSRLFANGTRLGGLLKFPVGKGLKDDTKRKTLIDSWNAAFGGVGNTGKTALLEDGLEWQAMGMTAEDSQMIEMMQFSIADIARIFGVPLHKLSELTRSTNNNIEHQGIEWVTDEIRPGAVQREQALARDLLFGRSDRTHCIMFDLDGLMRGDSKATAEYWTKMTQGAINSRNEARVATGWNRSPDKNMDAFTLQLNMTTIDKVGEAPPVATPAAVADEPKPDA